MTYLIAKELAEGNQERPTAEYVSRILHADINDVREVQKGYSDEIDKGLYRDLRLEYSLFFVFIVLVCQACVLVLVSVPHRDLASVIHPSL